MIETKNLVKSFQDGEVETRVLKGIDFIAKEGEFIAIMGRSGAGKSTFLKALINIVSHLISNTIGKNGSTT